MSFSIDFFPHLIYNKLENLSKSVAIAMLIFSYMNRVRDNLFILLKRRIHMKTKRFLSTILAIVFVLSTFTFSVATVNAESGVVYLDN